MTITGRLPQPARRGQFLALLLLAITAGWALFHTAHILLIHSSRHTICPTHDLYSYYSVWFVLGHRECADFAVRESLYFPHTWLVFTPLFMWGWPIARALMFLINVAAVLYSWWRLSNLGGLQGLRRWLLLTFFLGWSGTGNVIGLGNLALVSLATMLAAYPFSSAKSGVWLTVACMKQSLVFPLFLHLLLKRSKALIVPILAIGLGGLAVLWWAHMSIADGFRLPRYWVATTSTWTDIDHTGLRRVMALFISNASVVGLGVWAIWFALFGVTVWWIKDPLSQFAALLLLCLLPTYHYAYDMVVAAPALAVFMKRCRLVWPTVMTFFLSVTLFGQLSRHLPAGPLRTLCEKLDYAYYPIIILVAFAGLLWLEARRQRDARDSARKAAEVVPPQPTDGVTAAA
jgi:hypothetical protein